ncbi:DUF4194 domain-containing protein [Corynebacterium matruchotii]|uniref:DUF4194 domain-containing protein n=2 Tax=Corynebacterium matruchotii TaxID=43768 RepID=E0DFS8_9CORY|nr:DUF4194 domain-containing protein [Corynebacterium matruchotii]EFM49210.1 hypothetical protein HMPREF0299_6722 [Corynebacterium matruchotii ATCC 14266]QSX72420.1 DUF4194 domain-containing protein [Corynebacterium matruchotii]SPW30865.1 Uncharacterised protein [Corynebacterium matruchotii]
MTNNTPINHNDQNEEGEGKHRNSGEHNSFPFIAPREIESPAPTRHRAELAYTDRYFGGRNATGRNDAGIVKADIVEAEIIDAEVLDVQFDDDTDAPQTTHGSRRALHYSAHSPADADVDTADTADAAGNVVDDAEVETTAESEPGRTVTAPESPAGRRFTGAGATEASEPQLEVSPEETSDDAAAADKPWDRAAQPDAHRTTSEVDAHTDTDDDLDQEAAATDPEGSPATLPTTDAGENTAPTTGLRNPGYAGFAGAGLENRTTDEYAVDGDTDDAGELTDNDDPHGESDHGDLGVDTTIPVREARHTPLEIQEEARKLVNSINAAASYEDFDAYPTQGDNPQEEFLDDDAADLSDEDIVDEVLTSADATAPTTEPEAAEVAEDVTEAEESQASEPASAAVSAVAETLAEANDEPEDLTHTNLAEESEESEEEEAETAEAPTETPVEVDDKPEPGQPTPEQPATLVTPPAQPAAPTAAHATASAVTTNAAPVETEDTFDWMEDDYVHTSIGGDNLWDSDAGTLSFDSRRALVQLLQGPLVRAEQHPPIWKAILSDETALRQRLADMFLDLVVDEDAGIAFTRIANSGNPIRVGKEHYVDMPHVLRVKTLTIIDTIVLLDLRTRLGLAVPGERVIVDQEELRENASQFRALDDRDEATFNRRFDASLDRMRRDYSLLGDTETEGRYEVSPALKHIFDAQTVAGIKAEFEELLAREESK